jgi:hypothetical protein
MGCPREAWRTGPRRWSQLKKRIEARASYHHARAGNVSNGSEADCLLWVESGLSAKGGKLPFGGAG